VQLSNGNSDFLDRQKCVKSTARMFLFIIADRPDPVLDGIHVCALVNHVLLCKGQHN
jgi:hypothetical protein